MKKLLRVAGYTRVSSDTDDQLNSLDNQTNFFTEYISHHDGWTLVDIYVDEGITGTNTSKRDGFNRMISDAENGKIDFIVTKEVSRFARNTVDTLMYTRKLKAIGVGVFFMNDNINTLDNDGEFRLSIMASVAQEESRKTSERVKWGMHRKMEQGFVMLKDMIGYDCEDGVLTINEEEAEVVRLIFTKYAYEHKGIGQIAKELTATGTPKFKRLKTWSPTAISRILRNEKYVGDLKQHKTYTPDYLSHKSVKNCGETPYVMIPDHHEPIIDRGTWNLTQDILENRNQLVENRTKYSNRYWCSGKIICGVCGSIYTIKSKRIKSGQYRAWRCKQKIIYGTCPSHQVNEKVLLACVKYALQQIMDQSLALEVANDIKNIGNSVEVVDTSHIQKSITSLNAKKEKLMDMLVEDLINKDEYITMKSKYDTELFSLNARLQKIKDTNEKPNSDIANLDLIDKIRDIIDQKTPCKEVYAEIVEKIIVYRDSFLVIKFFDLDTEFTIKYETSGRGKLYTVYCA